MSSDQLPQNLSPSGNLKVEIEAPTTAFGELSVAEPTAACQASFAYGINAQIATTTTTGSGSATGTGGICRLTTTAAASSSAKVATRRFLKYSPGKGAVVRATGLFTTGVAGSTQLLGYGSASDGFFFGYNGTRFGILHRRNGIRDIRTLTVSVGASGTESVTVNLGTGVAVTFNVSNGTATANATTIAAQTYTGWTARQLGATVVFIADAAATKTGTFTLVNNTGGGTCAGSIVNTLAGLAPTQDWYYQEDWDDPCDGTGTMPVMDWKKGNVFQIKFQWLGFGEIQFGIESSTTGQFETVHKLKWANANTTPSVRNPSLPVMAEVTNTTNDTAVIMDVCCLTGFIEGSVDDIGPCFSTDSSATGVGTSYTPLFTIRNPNTFAGTENRVPALVRFACLAADGTKPGFFQFVRGATLTGPVWQSVSAGSSCMEVDIAATAYSSGTAVLTLITGQTEGTLATIPTRVLEVFPGETLTVVAKVTGATSDLACGVTWQELIA